MKNQLIALTLGMGSSMLTEAITPIGEHVDVRFTYNNALDTWTGKARTTETGSDVLRDFNDVFFPLSDKAYQASNPANSGARNIQPSSATYSFTGVAAGQPLWIAVQGTPGIGEAWPGFENNQATGTLGAYLETDSRLPQPQTLSREWITVHLKNVIYQGTGATPEFSMWTISSGTPRIWMSTANGISSGDTYLYAVGAHNHMNFGFGALGIYRIQITSTAYRGPGMTHPTAESAIHTLTFAVGPVANWQANHFTSLELENPTICGMTANPDHDELTNLQEFAFGYDPRSGTRLPISTGLGLPVFSIETENHLRYQIIEYPRRKTLTLTKPLKTTAEFSHQVNSWQAQATETETVSEFMGEQAALNAVWEKVRIKRLASAESDNRGFFRIKTELPD